MIYGGGREEEKEVKHGTAAEKVLKNYSRARWTSSRN